MEIIENLLFDFVDLYNEIKVNDDSPRAKNCYRRLKGDFQEILEQDIDYLSVMDNEFANDSQLYILVLSTLFFCSKDVKILEKIKELLFLDDLPLDVTLRILKQIAVNHFSNGFAAPEYSQERELHLHLLQRLQKELKVSKSYIPYEERNHNLIILETDTLLLDTHAPSKMVLDIYKMLKYELGYEVYLLVNFLEVEEYNMEGFWVFPYRMNYIPMLNGEFVSTHEGIEIFGYQQIIHGNDISSFQNSIEYVYSKKPEFVWHIGAQSVFADMLKNITTLVSMPCTDGYAISEAPIQVSYMRVDKEMVKQMEEYNRSRAQKMIETGSMKKIELDLYTNQIKQIYKREDFGIPTDSFVIAIVGNRLDTELTDEFLSIMQKIVDREKNIYFAIIGNSKMYKWKTLIKERVVYLGFRKDLVEVMKITDLFLNPPRKGGGGGAECAIMLGIPVITLPNCDVAHMKEEFVCDSLEKFPELVSEYCHNEEFYQSKVRVCKRLQEKVTNIVKDGSSNLEKTVTKIKELCQQGY